MFFNNIVFWKKLVLISVIPLLIISIMIGALSYNRTNRVARESAKNSLVDALNRIDITITVRTRQLDKAAQAIANSVSGEYLIARATEEQIDALRLRSLCENLVEPFQEVSTATILIGEQVVYISRADLTPNPERIAALYREAEKSPSKTIWSNLTDSMFLEQQRKGATAIQVFCAIRNEDDRTVGILVLELDPAAIGSAVLLKQEILNRQSSFLIGRKNVLIYSDGPISDEMVNMAMEVYSSGRRMFSMTVEDRSYYCCAQYNGMVGWITFSVIAEDELFSESQSLRRYIGLLVLCCVAVAAALQMILSRMITRPLGRLKAGMKQVQNNNFEVHLENSRKDEIGELTDSFNYMVDQIRTLINRVYREQLAQKNAEMESLQAQINPHFLYNALDSINWMLIERGEMEISSIVVAMGKLMQYSMDTNVSKVPLREEYGNARNYLLIQKNRLEDQLEYQLELDAGLENVYVPKLILQPLIENSIKHGVVGADHPCTVLVKTICRGDRICIMIRDNGAGMTPEKLEVYRRLLNGTEEEQRGIGIRNVARRLQLHFNDQCEFSVTSSPHAGTTLSLLLPITTKEEWP